MSVHAFSKARTSPGSNPFEGHSTPALLHAIVYEHPTSLATLCPDLPPAVVSVVDKCLAKLPDGRFATAGDLEVALAACRCAGDWTEERAIDWWERHPEATPGTGTDLATLPLRESEG